MGIKGFLYRILDILRQKKYKKMINPYNRLYCFDIIASNDKDVIILKYFKNIDSCSRVIADEMKKLSLIFEGIPIIIGEKAKKQLLEDDIIYKRFGITVVSPRTFELWLKEKRYPLFYAERGGIYVKIDGEKIRSARERLGLSLGDLARKVGVSRKAIYSYEKHAMETTPYIAYRLEEVLGTSIIIPLTIAFHKHSLSYDFRDIMDEKKMIDDPKLLEMRRKLMTLGYNVIIHMRAPFELSALSVKGRGGKRIIVKKIKRDVEEIDLLKKMIDVANRNILLKIV